MVQTKAQTLENKVEQTVPIIISARTGLTPADKALKNRLPKDYAPKSIKEALSYLLQPRNLQSDERALAKSVSKEIKAQNFTVVVNGKNAKLTHKVADYLVDKEHILPNLQKKPYRALEIEVSAVQEGGNYLIQ